MSEMTGMTADYKSFAAGDGGDFTMHTPEGTAVPAQLAAVTPTDEATGSFTLDFRTGPDGPSGQGTYLLRGRESEAIPVFLVPSGRDGAGTTFHAVFNFQTPPSIKDGEH